MKPIPKLIVFHQSLYKPPSSTHRLYLFTFFLLFTITFLLTLLKSTSSSQPSSPYNNPHNHLSTTVSAALLHYATASAENSTVTGRMTGSEINVIGNVIRECDSECKLLVFGFTHETLLWKALNFGEGRRTVFVDENEYTVAKYENNFTDIEAYDVQYTTKVRKWKEMIKYARAHRTGECRPTQNLLFSDCQLAINDLPNHLYEIPWDVILIDGPRGYSPEMPGRMAAIYTAAVMSRTRTRGQTHVFVHDYGREIERVYSEEFLCKENLVDVHHNLGHYIVRKREDNDKIFEFCERGRLSSK